MYKLANKISGIQMIISIGWISDIFSAPESMLAKRLRSIKDSQKLPLQQVKQQRPRRRSSSGLRHPQMLLDYL